MFSNQSLQELESIYRKPKNKQDELGISVKELRDFNGNQVEDTTLTFEEEHDNEEVFNLLDDSKLNTKHDSPLRLQLYNWIGITAIILALLLLSLWNVYYTEFDQLSILQGICIMLIILIQYAFGWKNTIVPDILLAIMIGCQLLIVQQQFMDCTINEFGMYLVMLMAFILLSTSLHYLMKQQQ